MRPLTKEIVNLAAAKALDNEADPTPSLAFVTSFSACCMASVN